MARQNWYTGRRYGQHTPALWCLLVPRELPMRRTKVEPPTVPTLATRKRALPAAPPAENNDEKQLSAKQARALAALQIKMTPVVKTPAPHAQDGDAYHPAFPPHRQTDALTR